MARKRRKKTCPECGTNLREKRKNGNRVVECPKCRFSEVFDKERVVREDKMK